MADNIKTPLITSDPLSYFAKGVKGAVDERSFVGSNDVLVRKSVKGSQFAIHPKFKYAPNYMNYVGDWNISASYNVNDVVNVFDVKVGDDPTKSAQTLLEEQLTLFFNPLGFHTETLTAPDGDTMEVYVGNYTPPQVEAGALDFTIYIPKVIPTPGTYICVAPVPTLNFIYDLAGAGIINPNVIGPNSIAASYARLNLYNMVVNGQITPFGILGINYFPHHPELPTTPHLNVNNLNTATGSYWRMLSLYGNGGGDSCQCRYH